MGRLSRGFGSRGFGSRGFGGRGGRASGLPLPLTFDGAHTLHDIRAASLNNGDPVVEFPERSSLGLVGEQPVGSQRGTFDDSGTAPAASFDGIDDLYTVGAVGDYDFLHEAGGSVFATVHPDNITESLAFVFGNTGGATVKGFHLYISNGKVRIFVADGSSSSLVESISTISAGTFSTIGATYDASGATVYINGSADNTGTLATLSSGGAGEVARISRGGRWAGGITDIFTSTKKLTANAAADYHAWSLGI